MRFYGCSGQVGQIGRVHKLNAGSREFALDVGDGAIEVDGAAGIAEDKGGKTEAARIEGRVADAVVVGEAGEKDTRKSALAKIASEAGGRGAVILKECRIRIDLRSEAFAQDQLGCGDSARDETRLRRALHAMSGHRVCGP